MIVDDDPMNVQVIKAMLELHGVACDSAYSGREALELINLRIPKVK